MVLLFMVNVAYSQQFMVGINNDETMFTGGKAIMIVDDFFWLVLCTVTFCHHIKFSFEKQNIWHNVQLFLAMLWDISVVVAI